MAESIVSNVVGKLGELLIQEVNFLHGVDGELRSLRDEFQWIQAVLKDADASIQGGNERAKTWVNQVRDVAYDTEDVIDTYIFKIHRQSRVSQGWFSWLTTHACHPCGLTILHDLGNKIGEVKRRADMIYANRSKYGIENITATSSESLTNEEARLPLSWKQTSPVVEEVDVIGFDEHVKSLKQLLLTEVEGRRAVISIVGMGGLGKTTLAKKVFSNPTIKKNFACHVWVYVSQSYRDRELVESIAKQLIVVDKARMNDSTDEELKKMVYEHLKEKRYLVVLDDVWTRGAWDNIKEMLTEMTKKGSKVLLTTRNRDVALHADRQSPPFDLKLLGEEESWELFCKKAIPTKCREHCPPELETIGREMVAKCRGLPLAIVVLGGLVLRKEQSEEEWRKLLKSVIWQLREGEDQISKILALSYHHLPYYMKPSFLYFAMFPEDFLIDAKDVILKWMAEGFIEARDEETMEEVAEDYLEELVHRSLIQVAERNELGGIMKCRIHDLLLDLAISEAKGTNFLLVAKTNNNNELITLQKPRRIALHGHKSRDITTWQYYSTDSFLSLRTVSYFDTDGTGGKLITDWFLDELRSCGLCLQINKMKCMVPKSFTLLQILISSMKLLKVIDLRDVPTMLPNAIGELIHLRYLNVHVQGSNPLPSSIGELTNLQTLKIQNIDSITEVPSEIWKLKSNLRHLECDLCSIKGQTSAESLPYLQTLSRVEAESSRGANEIPTSILTASNHKHLRRLCLYGELERLPEVLYLRYNAFVGEKMVCLEKAFPQLKELAFVSLRSLEEWKIEDETMPRLRTLIIHDCWKLVMLPHGLGRITSLQELHVRGMPNAFKNRLRENDGEDWDKVRHIPSILYVN